MLVVIGDVHGHREPLLSVMKSAGLVDETGQWTAGSTQLWFMGDYFDRGPDGVGVVELIMRLQAEAAEASGKVGALLGNHDAHLLAAHDMGDARDGSREQTFRASWLANGGEPEDMERLKPHHIEWIRSLPSMVVVDDHLLAHADATFYTNYGKTTEAVNDMIARAVQSDIPQDRSDLLDYFSQRRAFVDRFLGRERAARFLRTYGGRQFVHAHTPVFKLAGKSPKDYCQAYVYAGGLCVDVDPGMYLGGRGFVTYLDGA